MNLSWIVRRVFAATLGFLVAGCSPTPTPPSSPVASSDPRTPAPPTIATASPEATPKGLPEAVRDALATPGAIAVANIEPEGSGWWVLTVSVARVGRPVVRGGLRFRGDGWEPFGNDGPSHEGGFDILTGSVRMTREGWTAIEVNGERGLSVMVLNAFDQREVRPVIEGSAPIWLPDGTLLVSGGPPTPDPHGQGVRRATDHGFGEILDLVIPARKAFASFPLNYIVHGDLSGVEGSAGDGNEWGPVTITWDGTLVPRMLKDPPYLALGVERSAGSRGERILCEGWGPCPVAWQRPRGRVLTHPAIDIEHAWTRDGRALVVLDGTEPNVQDDDRVLLIHDSPSGLVTRQLAQPAPGEFDGGLFFFRGMSDWAVALERDSDRHVNVFPLDGSPVIGPLVGTVALVNP